MSVLLQMPQLIHIARELCSSSVSRAGAERKHNNSQSVCSDTHTEATVAAQGRVKSKSIMQLIANAAVSGGGRGAEEVQ